MGEGEIGKDGGREGGETQGESGLVHLKSFISTLSAPVAERTVLSDTSLALANCSARLLAAIQRTSRNRLAVRCLVLGVLGARRGAGDCSERPSGGRRSGAFEVRPGAASAGRKNGGREIT